MVLLKIINTSYRRFKGFDIQMVKFKAKTCMDFITYKYVALNKILTLWVFDSFCFRKIKGASI